MWYDERRDFYEDELLGVDQERQGMRVGSESRRTAAEGANGTLKA